MAVLFATNVSSTSVTSSPVLEGVGYREQELQVAKGTEFKSENATGVKYASWAGGTHIFVKGANLHDNPQSNFVQLQCHQLFAGTTFTAPLLTEDDAFNS